MLKRYLILPIAALILAASMIAGNLHSQSNTTFEPEEVQLLAQINDYRESSGLSTDLVRQENLESAAEWMGADMGEHSYFSHTDSQGRGFDERLVDFGYTYGGWRGENLARGYSTPELVMQAWINSEGHRLNILRPEYEYIGLARVYVAGSEAGWYWVTDFAGNTAQPVPLKTSAPGYTATPAPTPEPTPVPTPEPTPVPTTPPPPTCECDSYVQEILEQTFSFDLWTALYVVERESRFDPGAYHENWDGSVDLGLFQINSIHAGRWPDYWTAWSDPARNAQWALELYMEQGWRPWRIW